MNCAAVSKLIPLYYYGELTPDEEDHLDQHLHECVICSTEMERQRTLAAALDQRRMAVPPLLLDECRDDLMAAIAGGAPRVETRSKGPWTLFLEAMGATLTGFGRMRQPAGALLLVLVGVVVGRYAFGPMSSGALNTASFAPSDNVFSNVRSVKSGSDGKVQITLDETRRREVSGTLEDPMIQRFILAGSRDENPAVRVVAVGLLRSRADSKEALDSLLNVLANDSNLGVRLKAIEALRPLAGDPRVVQTLAQVLMTDADPAVKMQVIDLMVTRRDDSFVGLLQNLMQREDNNGVRLKASKVLKELNASTSIF